MIRSRWLLGCLTSLAVAVLASCTNTTGSDGGSDASCAGTIGCECVAGSCTSGECVGGTCTDCKRGEAACICRSNNTCNTGLKCSGTGGTCQTCAAGAEGCACGSGNTCNSGLKCDGTVCVQDTCVAGAATCPCKASDPKCDSTNYCDTNNLCQTCSPDIAGCPCGAANVCTGGLVCDTGPMKCRVAKTCADLATANTCVAHQTCAEGSSGSDATCVTGSCDANFKWNPTTNTCVACESNNCAAEPNCADDGGIATDCDVKNRSCVQAGQVAACGMCKTGFAEPRVDAGTGVSACVPAPACGNTTCTLDQYCDVNLGCTALPCAPGSARTYDNGTGQYGACAVCNRQCNGVGFSGRIWPFQTHLGECICETLPGYFIPQGLNGQFTLCDADHDGWVRGDADDPTVRNDPALLANSRCPILKVDKVRLVDEYGISADVKSCTEGLMISPDAGACTGVVPIRLLETPRNDIGSTNPAKLPPYGTAGRLLEANEINAITKACVSLSADYNDNGVDDISEVQARGVISSDDQVRLASFAYFMELYNASFESSGGTAPGTLVIKERSRCSTDFPLRYDFAITDPLSTADHYDPAVGQTYWRNCARKRDATYTQASTVPGYDFAHWDCDVTSGTCPTIPPARADGGVGPNPDPTKELIRDFGLCELNGAKPADGVWRGFNHHSQFKCVNVTSTPTKPFDHNQGEFGNGKLVFNQCFAQPCNGPTCRTNPGVGPQTAAPVLHCLATNPAAGAVGIAGVSFNGYAASGSYVAQAYSNGCIAEDEESRTALTIPGPTGPTPLGSYLCPYPEQCNTLFNDGTCSPAKGRADSSFGRYSCYGQLANFLWCDSVPNPQRATLRWATGPLDTANGFLR